ncbi:hypothetical protein FHG87_017160 [Trinorchestia longiramus]|nr:hypothetical protein FHG87_017160 [Trinorchestia longiramus]
MDVENFTVKLEEETCSSPDQITIELNSFDTDGDSSYVVDHEDDCIDEEEDEEEDDEEDDDEDYVIENEDDNEEEEEEEEEDVDDIGVDNSFSKLQQRKQDASHRGGSICVVRKPHRTKLEQSSHNMKLKRRAEQSGQSRKRGCSAKQSVTTLRQVVSDAPHENKLKKPGPFQAASKVASVSNLKMRYSWLKKPKQVYSDGEDESLTIADEAANEMSSVSCGFCGVLLSSALECDLHIVAQHKYEKAVQEIPLQCLEEGCFVQCTTISDLKKHLSIQHSIDFSRRNFTFKNMDEFQTWKTDLETANYTRFRFFSCFSEVTGGTTRVYVCNNEGRYDMTRAKHQRRRRAPGVKTGAGVRRTGRACPAQLLVRAWGWGAVEVHALLTHYGHCKNGALVGVLASTEVLGGVKGDSKEEGGGGGRRHVGRPVEYSSTREDGVRIIEGALIGARGMEDLQTDLTAWNLVDNVSRACCVCHASSGACENE